MTKAELTKYRKFLEDKLAELSEVVRNREGITIEKNADALTKCSTPPSASWPSGTSTVSHSC